MARRLASLLAFALVLGALGATIPSRPAVADQPPEPTADDAGAAKYRPMVDAAVVELAAQLGVAPLSKPPVIQLLSKKLPEGGEFAQEWYYLDTGTCLLQVQPAGQKLGPVDIEFVLTHEVVHCYQDRETGGADVTDWVEEGAAMWAAAKLVPGSAITKKKWVPYLAAPTKSLFTRSYDGIGFFGHLEDAGVDVWHRIVAMMTAGGNAAAFDVGTAGAANALDDWAPGLFREDGIGGAWATTGPDIPDTTPPRASKALGNASSAKATAAKAGVALLELDVSADVVTVLAPSGAHGRIRDGSGSDRLLSEVSGRPLCTTPGGCACPDGTPAAGAAFGVLAPGVAWLGATGGSKATTVTVSGRSLDEFCAKPAKVDACIVGTWIGQGVTLSLPEIAITGSGGQGAVLRFEKNGTGSVDMDPSTPVAATLPGGLVGTFAMSGQAGGLVNASQGVMRTITTTSSGFQIVIDVPPLGGQTIPLTGGASAAPFDGQYTCTKTTLVYAAPGFGGQSTWTRAS
jgi:hypothetical protein